MLFTIIIIITLTITAELKQVKPTTKQHATMDTTFFSWTHFQTSYYQKITQYRVKELYHLTLHNPFFGTCKIKYFWMLKLTSAVCHNEFTRLSLKSAFDISQTLL